MKALTCSQHHHLDLFSFNNCVSLLSPSESSRAELRVVKITSSLRSEDWCTLPRPSIVMSALGAMLEINSRRPPRSLVPKQAISSSGSKAFCTSHLHSNKIHSLKELLGPNISHAQGSREWRRSNLYTPGTLAAEFTPFLQ